MTLMTLTRTGSATPSSLWVLPVGPSLMPKHCYCGGGGVVIVIVTIVVFVVCVVMFVTVAEA